jgi:long-chain acyl-CoA synthetase
MSISTLNDIFFAAMEHDLERMILHREAGQWLPLSSREFSRRVACTATALDAWGIRAGDRIAILSENRPEWPMADMASLLLGAVTVPLYTTLTAEQSAFALNDSGCRAIFLSSDHQLQKILPVLSQTQIQRIILMDHVELASDVSRLAACSTMDQIMQDGPDVLPPAL